MKTIPLAAASIALLATSALAAEPTGEWLVADKTARIQIERCPTGLWGIISWLRQPAIDDKNPDSAKRGRPMIGVPILLGMKEAARPGLWEGEVYNPKNGKTYEARIALENPNTLRIEGCLIGGMFCGGETWTRVSAPPETTGAARNATARDACAAP